jgi:hypothetical protein
MIGVSIQDVMGKGEILCETPECTMMVIKARSYWVRTGYIPVMPCLSWSGQGNDYVDWASRNQSNFRFECDQLQQ